MLKIIPSEHPIPKLHSYLLSAVAPRPIAFASTIDKDGLINLSPFSFFNVFSANPPILIFSPARSGRTSETKDTYKNVLEVKEVVINIVNYDMAEQMSVSSSPYPKGVNEFEKAGFTAIDSEFIKPKRVAESPIQIECKVNDIIELGTGGGAGNLIICEVLCMHINENVLDHDNNIDTTKLDLIARMGANYYCRATGNALFEIKKPLTTIGIGYDTIPDWIKNSTEFTGNELGKLSSIEQLPDKNTFTLPQYKKDIENVFSSVKSALLDNDTFTAWCYLLNHKSE